MDTTIYDLAEEILQNALDALDQDRQPARAYVSTNVPAHDIGMSRNECDGVLVVHIRNLRNWSEGQTTEQCAFRPAVDLTVTIIRCATAWENGQAPSIDTLGRESSELLSDIWEVFLHLAAMWTARTLFNCQTECRQVRFGRMVPSGPLGGAAAWTLDLTIIDPYTCDEGS